MTPARCSPSFTTASGSTPTTWPSTRGLIAALEWALEHGHTRLHVRSDSLLIVQQMLGAYRVKHEGLIPLYQRARMLAAKIGNVTFEHVRREYNKEADRLSNLGMDLNSSR